MVHQHFMLVETFTVLENIILGFEGEFIFGEKLKEAKKNLEKLCKDYNLQIDLDATIADLSVGFRQRVEILKALYRQAEILILDEPTGFMDAESIRLTWELLKDLKGEKSIIYVSNSLTEVEQAPTPETRPNANARRRNATQCKCNANVMQKVIKNAMQCNANAIQMQCECNAMQMRMQMQTQMSMQMQCKCNAMRKQMQTRRDATPDARCLF